jgi:hypothetical protein
MSSRQRYVSPVTLVEDDFRGLATTSAVTGTTSLQADTTADPWQFCQIIIFERQIFVGQARDTPGKFSVSKLMAPADFRRV